MTIFDLLFIALFFCTLGALVAAAVFALSGRRTRALGVLRRLAICAGVYLGIVYVSAVFAKQTVLRVGDPQCNDDWCLAVDGVERMPHETAVLYRVTLRIFSRALRVAMRENGASDVYLTDSQGNRYDPFRQGSEIPLNTLLQAGESVTTTRLFEMPAGARNVSLFIGRHGLPKGVCLIIGECDVFHGPPAVRID
ncbi:MAG TPA: hypothetical protein VLY04_20150 [Bryobacteraceae bacterium]|nr:hypothetical protein [Bryobacteraceae bacterium]